MKENYFYCACDAQSRGGEKVNESHRFYFRLYRGEIPLESGKGGAILIEQGLADKVDEWEVKYNAVFSSYNPFPNLD